MPPRALKTTFVNLGHMSLYSGFYAAGCILLVIMVLGMPTNWPLIAAALATTWFVYLLHRVRSATRPGAPWSQRVLYYGRNRGLVRLVLWGSGAAAFLSLLLVKPWACLLIPASICGMLLYGHGRNGKRVRDRLVLKNATVAFSMVSFCIVLVLLGSKTVPGWYSTMLVALLALFLVILSDALLCDFADIEVDQQTSTRTIPIHLGHARAWMIADFSILVAGMLLAFLWWRGSISGVVGLGIPFLVVTTQLLLRRIDAERLRHAVDLRLPLAVTVVFLVLTYVNSST